MEQLVYLLITLIASSSIISAGNDTNISSSTIAQPTTLPLEPTDSHTEKTVSATSHYKHVMTSHTFQTVSTTHLSSSHTAGTTVMPGGNLSSSKSASEHNITTSSPLTSSKSYTEATQHTVSFWVSKITGHSNITRSEVTAAPSQAPDNGLTMLAFGVMSLILILIVVMVILVTAINLRGRCKKTKQQGIKSYGSMVSDSNMTNNWEKESITLVSVRTLNTDNDTDSPQVSSVRSTIVDSEDQELNTDLLST